MCEILSPILSGYAECSFLKLTCGSMHQGTAITGRREWTFLEQDQKLRFTLAHIAYCVPLLKIADFLAADVEVRSVSVLAHIG